MASRDLTAAMLSEITAATLYPVIFYEGEFVPPGSPADSAFLRLWTGVESIQWNGYTWTGAGHLLSISSVEERNTIEAIGFTVTVSGMPSANLSLALQAVRQGKPGKLWLGCLDSAGALIADPYLLQEGKADVSIIDDSGDECTIKVQYESRLVNLLRPRVRRYTHEDQKIDYPTDRGFQFVPTLQEKQLIWGGPAGGDSIPGGQGGGGVGEHSDDGWGPSGGD